MDNIFMSAICSGCMKLFQPTEQYIQSNRGDWWYCDSCSPEQAEKNLAEFYKLLNEE